MIEMPPLFLVVVVYVLIWWTMLFAVLPIYSRPETDPDPVSGVRGGMSRPPFAKVILTNTLVSTLLWAGAMVVICHKDWLSFHSGFLAIQGE